MEVSFVCQTGTVLSVLCTVFHETTTEGITYVTLEQGGEYVFLDGMERIVTRVSINPKLSNFYILKFRLKQ